MKNPSHEPGVQRHPSSASGASKDLLARRRKEAVSLRYDPGPGKAPRVTAKGRGSLAEEIMRIAREFNIPIREDKNLIQILSRLDLDEQIPPELYRVIAEILAFVYRTSVRYQEIAAALAKRPGAASSSTHGSSHASIPVID